VILAQNLHNTGLGAFPCRQDKTPAIQKGSSWKTEALRPPAEHSWPTGLVGVPIPAGVIVIDLDLYKGVTREAVERLLGCALPWDAALIQSTQGGGEHYAFQVDWPGRTGSNLGGLKGLDTRSTGKGYICTGSPGYTAYGLGVFRLARPAFLPCLPDQARGVLEHAEPSTVQPTNSQPPPDLETVADALRYIKPGCGRSLWVKVGMALRTITDDPSLFDQWSSGELAGIDAPSNYNSDHIQWQWGTFDPAGITRIGSLYYEAVQAGWRPPSGIDTAAAFGAGSTDAGTFNQTVDAILSSGGDPKQTDALISAIRVAGGNALQVATLLALLTRELKDAGLLTSPIRKQLDALAGGSTPHRPEGSYGKNHTENSTLFITRRYPDNTLVRSDQEWYFYTGRAWEPKTEEDIRHELTRDMAPALPQASNVAGTYTILSSHTHRAGQQINDIDPALVLFHNGVLDLRTAHLSAHSPDYFTTSILPYNYEPSAKCAGWLHFLDEVFEGDGERIALLQEWFGYMMSNSYDYHKIMFMIGSPRSGKGTTGRVLEQVVGAHNFTGASLHSFSSDAFINALRTKPVAFSGDTERHVGHHVRDRVIERLKKISGNDAVEFDRKWKSSLSQTLPTRITLAGNTVPGLFDDSGALANRLLILTYDESWANRESPQLLATLLVELPGIAVWSLEGLRRLNTTGRFTEPAASLNEKKHIADSFSPLMQFIEEACTLGPDYRASCADLHGAYRAWAVKAGETTVMSRRTFISAFKDTTRSMKCKYGVHKIDGTSQRAFTGVYSPTPAAAAFKPQVVK